MSLDIPLLILLIFPSLIAALLPIDSHKSKLLLPLKILFTLVFLVALLFGDFGALSYRVAQYVWSVSLGQTIEITFERTHAVGIFITWISILPIALYLKKNFFSLAERPITERIMTSFTIFYGWHVLVSLGCLAVGL